MIMNEKRIVCACIIGEIIAVVGIIVLASLKKHIPTFIMGFYGFCMIIAFIMIVVIMIKKSR